MTPCCVAPCLEPSLVEAVDLLFSLLCCLPFVVLVLGPCLSLRGHFEDFFSNGLLPSGDFFLSVTCTSQQCRPDGLASFNLVFALARSLKRRLPPPQLCTILSGVLGVKNLFWFAWREIPCGCVRLTGLRLPPFWRDIGGIIFRRRSSSIHFNVGVSYVSSTFLTSTYDTSTSKASVAVHSI